MLAKRERIPRKLFAQARGTRTRFSFGVLVHVPRVPPRASVVISQKVCRTATARNRLRRRVYSILRDLLRHKKFSHSVVVYPNKDAITASFPELKKALEGAVME